ncbi:MAG TPA: hypothetical protein VFV94_00855 [Polyangiaceae bacterium]|jgi:hypothetical protein|nr:hypothetical protein [Polyangiaceae bacterium]
MSERAGLLVRAGGELGFVPATMARSIVPLPPMSPVANTPLQMALVSGRVTPVVALGSPSSVLVVCDVDEEQIGFSGLEVSAVGSYEATERGVLVDGRAVPELDLLGALRSMEPALEPQLGEAP